MNVSFYIFTFILFINLNTSIEDFISAINNPNIKYDFGHWVIYEMNIGSFTGEGTFNTAAEKLPDIKDLGVDIIWLIPIYVRDGGGAADKINSPYASIDLENTNPHYGTIEEFKNFVNQAHQLNMQIWLDWVAAHTSNYHPWLTEHRDYYMEDLHPFYGDVSQLNYTNPVVPRIMNNILKKWIDTADIDGFRVDFISCPNITKEYWIQTLPEIKNYKPGKTIYFLGEADFTDKQQFFYTFWDYDYAWGFQEGSLYHDMGNSSDAGKLRYHCENIVNDDRYSDLDRMTYLTNHDMNFNHRVRLSDMYGENKYIFTVLIFTFYGMPLIYNGQEIGGEHVPLFISNSYRITNHCIYK